MRSKRSFSLIEILIVCTLLALIGGFSIRGVMQSWKRRAFHTALTQCESSLLTAQKLALLQQNELSLYLDKQKKALLIRWPPDISTPLLPKKLTLQKITLKEPYTDTQTLSLLFDTYGICSLNGKPLSSLLLSTENGSFEKRLYLPSHPPFSERESDALYPKEVKKDYVS